MKLTDPQEPLSRFIFDRSKISASRVKYSALLPRETSEEVSAYRISTLDDPAIGSLAKEYVEPGYGRATVGRGDFSVDSVHNAGLSADSAEPPPRHASIVGWPTDSAERKLSAMRLAERARPVLITR